MDIQWLLAEFFLQFTNTPALCTLFCLSIHSRYQRVVLAGFSLMCFNAIVGRYLKMLFMIPLPSAIGINDYAFPSGHMLAACTIYGFIAYHESHLLLRRTLYIILLGIAYGLIHHQYHNIYDVSAAVVIATTSIVALHQPLINQYKQTLLLLTILGAIIALLTPYGNQIPSTKVQHIWLNLGLLMGIHNAKTHKQHHRTDSLAHSIHSLLGSGLYYLGITLHDTLTLAPIYLIIPGYSLSYWATSTASRPKLHRFIQTLVSKYNYAST